MPGSTIVCPCCAYRTIDLAGYDDVCPVCHWEYDGVQSAYPWTIAGPNPLTLEQARQSFLAWGACTRHESFGVRERRSEEIPQRREDTTFLGRQEAESWLEAKQRLGLFRRTKGGTVEDPGLLLRADLCRAIFAWHNPMDFGEMEAEPAPLNMYDGQIDPVMAALGEVVPDAEMRRVIWLALKREFVPEVVGAESRFQALAANLSSEVGPERDGGTSA